MNGDFVIRVMYSQPLDNTLEPLFNQDTIEPDLSVLNSEMSLFKREGGKEERERGGREREGGRSKRGREESILLCIFTCLLVLGCGLLAGTLPPASLPDAVNEDAHTHTHTHNKMNAIK